MKIFKKEPNFKFMDKRYLAFAVSSAVIIGGIIMFWLKGFNLGVDFTGGTMIEVSFRENTAVNDLRKALGIVGLGKSEIQRVGKDENKFFIKAVSSVESGENIAKDEDVDEHEKLAKTVREALTSADEKNELSSGKMDINALAEVKLTELLRANGIGEEDAVDSARRIVDLRNNETGLINNFEELNNLNLKKRVFSVLQEKTFVGNFTFLSTEFVGPQVGRDLRRKATLATVWALIGMLIYIAFRFKFIYGMAAVITLFHDILISLSVILFFHIEVSLNVVAALMTIVGYSLNDTIVIFDRVRDNTKLLRREGAGVIIDRSINQTLSRTIVTSGTTLLTVLALFFLGGEVIHTFAFTVIVGILVGTYSSIFQSCAWLKIWEKSFLGKKR